MDALLFALVARAAAGHPFLANGRRAAKIDHSILAGVISLPRYQADTLLTSL